MAAEAKGWRLDHELRKGGDVTAAGVGELRSWCRENHVLPDISGRVRPGPT